MITGLISKLQVYNVREKVPCSSKVEYYSKEDKNWEIIIQRENNGQFKIYICITFHVLIILCVFILAVYNVKNQADFGVIFRYFNRLLSHHRYHFDKKLLKNKVKGRMHMLLQKRTRYTFLNTDRHGFVEEI